MTRLKQSDTVQLEIQRGTPDLGRRQNTGSRRGAGSSEGGCKEQSIKGVILVIEPLSTGHTTDKAAAGLQFRHYPPLPVPGPSTLPGPQFWVFNSKASLSPSPRNFHADIIPGICNLNVSISEAARDPNPRLALLFPWCLSSQLIPAFSTLFTLSLSQAPHAFSWRGSFPPGIINSPLHSLFKNNQHFGVLRMLKC